MWEWGLSTFCFFLLPSVTSPLWSLSLSPTTSPQVSPTEMIKSKSDCFEESPKNRPVGQNQWQQQIAGSFVLLRILRYTFSLYIHPCFVFIGCWFLFGQIRNQSESQKAITITFTSYLQVHTGLDPAAVRFKERLLYRGVCFEEEEDLTSRQCKVSLLRKVKWNPICIGAFRQLSSFLATVKSFLFWLIIFSRAIISTMLCDLRWWKSFLEYRHY